LADLLGQKRLHRSDIIEGVVTGGAGWCSPRNLTSEPVLAGGESVDLRAYALCVLDGLYRALRRRDVRIGPGS
jgi:hypothetical protein